jgi:uncharacterized protein (DUF2141 family)
MQYYNIKIPERAHLKCAGIHCTDFYLLLARMNSCGIRFFLLVMIIAMAGCANITAPTGGMKDKTPPKLVSITPADSSKNIRVKRIEMNFDEYVTLSDATKEVELSPILAVQPTVTGLNKRVVLKIVDSLLEDNTTYRISFGKAIKDLHEGNVFAHYNYTFSTGDYFDSLQLDGSVINAGTGLSDTGNILVELYSAKESDSAVVRHKPKYVTRIDENGNFSFKGLPRRTFRIYALKDVNGNLIYDGAAGGEMIAFNGKTVIPGDSMAAPIQLRIFPEVIDTSIKNTDTLTSKGLNKNKRTSSDPVYQVSVDTSNIIHRTFDINYPVNILFRNPPTINFDKITLTYDSAGTAVTPPLFKSMDTANPRLLHISTAWQENMVYTLRLVKGFAKDTAGKDLPPSRYNFRTKQDEDYGKITVNLPGKYDDDKYILLVVADKDTVYKQPVTDTIVKLIRLKPGIYKFAVIVDANHNGKWDTGNLFAGKQPEEVIPYNDQLTLKAGWENIIDFDKKPAPSRKPGMKNLPHK